MEKEIVLVTHECTEEQLQKLKEAAPEYEFAAAYTREDIDEEILQTATIAFGNIPIDLYQKAASLKWMQTASAGSDLYFTKENYRPEVTVTNCTGAFGMPISEYMVGCVLAFYKNLLKYKVVQPKKQWQNLGKVKYIEYSRVLCLGTGDIGSGFAKRMKKLGAYTIGVKRTPSNKPDYFDELYTTDHLDELLPQADILAISLPRTEDTVHIIDERRLKLLKEDALIINVGRGNAIDTKALYEHMKEGHLLGAALDVLEQEPLDPDNPLWNLDNLLITPHISGGNYQDETGELIFHVMFGNFERYMQGKELYNQVDANTGYKVSNS